MIDFENRELIAKALTTLKDNYKQIIMLYSQGFEMLEISEILNLPLLTVKSRFNKALKILKLKLKELEA